MDLSNDLFGNVLALRYGHSLGICHYVTVVTLEMNLTHSLNCKGGLMDHGHDQHRNHCASVSKVCIE